MAPMAIHDAHPLKRTASQAAFDLPAAKKLSLGPLKHHQARWDKQSVFRKTTSLQDDRIAEDLLTRSLELALKAVGFDGAEKGALDAFRVETEEYIAHFLADVRHSMCSSRRILAIPQDFLQSLHTHQLSLRSLVPHLKPPVPPTSSQYELDFQPYDPSNEQGYYDRPSIFAEASHNRSYIPASFPPLPDKHTYQATPDFAKREEDPRKIREKAAGEGRLAEEALRRLVAADTAASLKRRAENKRPQSLQEKRRQMWVDTMITVIKGQEKDGQQRSGDAMDVDAQPGTESVDEDFLAQLGHLSSGVNYERQFWRRGGKGS